MKKVEKKVIPLLQNINLAVAKKRWTKKEDFEAFWKWVKIYKQDIKKEAAAETFERFSGFTNILTKK